jgi:hypothetical protein
LRHRETDRDTERERVLHRERHSERDTDTDRQRQRETDRDTEKQNLCSDLYNPTLFGVYPDCPCPHSMVGPRVADGGTASSYGG